MTMKHLLVSDHTKYVGAFKHTFNNPASFIGITNSMRKIFTKVKVKQSLNRPITGPEGSRNLRLETVGT